MHSSKSDAAVRLARSWTSASQANLVPLPPTLKPAASMILSALTTLPSSYTLYSISLSPVSLGRTKRTDTLSTLASVTLARRMPSSMPSKKPT